MRLSRHCSPHHWVVEDQPLQEISPVLQLGLPLQLLTGDWVQYLTCGLSLLLASHSVELPVLTEAVLGTVASSPAPGTLVGLQRVLGAAQT